MSHPTDLPADFQPAWGAPLPPLQLIMSDFVPSEYSAQQIQDQKLALGKAGWTNLNVDVKHLPETRHYRYEFWGVRGALTGGPQNQ